MECKKCGQNIELSHWEQHIQQCTKETIPRFEAKILGVSFLKNNGSKIEVFNIKVKDKEKQQCWVVNRLYHQFLTMNEHLKKTFSMNLLENQQSEKISLLQNFLNMCVENEEIMKQDIARHFIGCKDSPPPVKQISKVAHTRTKSDFLTTTNTLNNTKMILTKESDLNKTSREEAHRQNDLRNQLILTQSSKEHIFTTNSNNLNSLPTSQSQTNLTISSKLGQKKKSINEQPLLSQSKSKQTLLKKKTQKIQSKKQKQLQVRGESIKQETSKQKRNSTDFPNNLENQAVKLVIPQSILKNLQKKQLQVNTNRNESAQSQEIQSRQMMTQRILSNAQPLDQLLQEEYKKLQQKRQSQEEKKDDSGEMDLLSYNEYIANARMAKQQKGFISKSGKLTPLECKIGGTLSSPLMITQSYKQQQISQKRNLKQAAEAHDGKSCSPSPEKEGAKLFNPTVLMKNQSMKDHFKKQLRENAYELLMNEQKSVEDEEMELEQKIFGAKTCKNIKPGHTRQPSAGVNVYNIRKEMKTLNFRTPPNEKVVQFQFLLKDEAHI